MNNSCICWGFHAYINEMHCSRSNFPSKKSRPHIYDVKFLALLGAPYIYVYDISRLRVNRNKVKTKGAFCWSYFTDTSSL
jgi:hypothetical protein